ncbi:MAG: SDR family oxidoreductase [Candidatus Nanopelagicales bacterium]
MGRALVTGPTSGIGNAFARRLAADGYDLVLVARNVPRLESLAAELRAVGVQVEVIPADLAERQQMARVEARLNDSSAPIDVLVNNAGFSINQHFVGGSLAREQVLLDVLVTAVMRLTHTAVPGMVSRGRGVVINVSSMAGFLPFGSYSAAKAWVTFFTQGLATELAGTGVKATAICPGFVHTEFHQRAGVDMSNSSDWMWSTADEVVDKLFSDLAHGKVLSIPGARYRALAGAAHLLPRDAVRRLERFRRGRLTR